MAHLVKGVGEREGTVAHGDADSANPLKQGGFATAALRAAVDENDVVDLSCDLQGQTRVVNDISTPLFMGGDIANDDPDSGTLPVKIGGLASATLFSAVANSDRVNALFTTQGGLLVAGVNGSNLRHLELNNSGEVITETAGDVGHDAADTGFPLKIGGVATAAAAADVNEGDRVQASFDRGGQLRVTNEAADPLIVSGNVAHDDADAGDPIKIGGRVFATLPTLANSDRVDAAFTPGGALVVAGSSGGTPVALDVNSAGRLFVEAMGNIAHDGIDTINDFPLKIGGHAYDSLPTAVADGDRVNAAYTLEGGMLLAGDDGSNLQNISVNASGQQEVVIIGGGGGGTNETDNAAFTGGSTAVTPMGALFDDSPPTITDGSIGAPLMTSGRILRVDTELPAAGVLGDTIGNPTTPTVGAFASFWNGSTWDRVRGDATDGLLVNLGSNNDVVGNVAHDAVDAGDPIKIGGRAQTALQTAAANNDRVNALFTTTGGLLTAGVDGTTPRNVAVNASGQQEVIIIGGGGTNETDNTAFTGGSTAVTPMGALFDSTPPTIATGNVGVPVMDSGRNLMIVGDRDHDAPDMNSSGPLKIGGHGSAALRAAVAEDDRTSASFDLQGRLRTLAFGDIAHDSPDSGNPVLTGGHANASLPSAVGENDRVRASYDLQGQLRVIATGSTGGTSAVDDSVFTGGSTNLTPMGALFDASPPTITDGSIGAPLMSSGRILLTEPGGNVAHDDADAGNPLKIGGRVRTNLDSVAANNDRTDAVFSTTGGILLAGFDVTGNTVRNVAVDDGGAVEIVGRIAHNFPDAGAPVKIGFKAVEFNSDPPTVSSDDDRVDSIGTPQGMQWVLGGHPNIINREWMTTGVQTNDPIIDSVAPGSQIIITAFDVTASTAGSTTPQIRIGFGSASVPAEPASGASVDGIIASLGGVAAGSGIVKGNGSGAIAIGGDGEELRITNAVPTGGKIVVTLSYFISTL